SLVLHPHPPPFPTRRSSDLLEADWFAPVFLAQIPVEQVEIIVASSGPDSANWWASKGPASTTRSSLSKACCRPRSCWTPKGASRSEEHTSELQSRENLVCRL